MGSTAALGLQGKPCGALRKGLELPVFLCCGCDSLHPSRWKGICIHASHSSTLLIRGLCCLDARISKPVVPCCAAVPARVFEGLKRDDLSAVECGADIRRMYDSVKTTFYESFLDACGERGGMGRGGPRSNTHWSQ